MFFTFILSVCIGYIGYYQYETNIISERMKYSGALVNIAEHIFEINNMPQIIKEKKMGKNYDNVRREFNIIKENLDISYIFSVYFEDTNDINSMCYVINGATKKQLEEAENESDVYSFMGEKCGKNDFDDDMKSVFLKCINEKDRNINYLKNETEEYGYQITCYKAVYDLEGNAVAIIGIDTSINEIKENLNKYLLSVGIFAIIFLIVFLILFIHAINVSVINPITEIAASSYDFVNQTNNNVEPDMLDFKKVIIHTKDEIKTLSESIENMAIGIINYMINLKKVTEEKGKIVAELNVATNIQSSMLPKIFPPFPMRKEIDIYATMKPAKEVGGDFYDFYFIDDNHFCVTVADVSGKGVPAALFMVIAKTLLKDHMMMGKSPADTFSKVNNMLSESNEENMFVTAWLAVLEISTLKLTIANAGHNPPLLKKNNEEFEYIKTNPGIVLACMPDISFTQTELQLKENDILYLYTDGITEATNTEGKLYGEKRLKDCLNNKCINCSANKVLENVKADIDKFVADASQFDDMTMLALKIMKK